VLLNTDISQRDTRETTL